MTSNVNRPSFLLFVSLLILANSCCISANSTYRQNDYPAASFVIDDASSKKMAERDNSVYESISDEGPSSDHWSVIFRPSYISAVPHIGLRSGANYFIPFNKRKIPLQLQKALYAHGIVGRRR